MCYSRWSVADAPAIVHGSVPTWGLELEIDRYEPRAIFVSRPFVVPESQRLHDVPAELGLERWTEFAGSELVHLLFDGADGVEVLLRHTF